ncbi:hypothetical protein UB33_09505 [Photobacterium angustum]|uniref:hypothetical protein n=1 Tax=Photobacterium angustum TaxID=661 RepID=UPI0005E9BED8|nr:hypothetical protein [Photobacterium angustum]KJG06470.1 hypothetical protein UB33_09505 [Photobacterium angustum]PSV94095.1 hypothetical protein CTN01_08855 [Photobacterium angustum]PSW78629.1 hypothetical protein CTN03_18295 [Photobacterium angustum]
MKNLILIFLLNLALAFSASANQPLTSQMNAYLIEVDKNGKELLKPADEVSPKDTVEYQLVYKNHSDQSLSGLVITGPIPENTQYVGNTGKTIIESKFLVSIDGGSTFETEPVKREIMKDGKKVEVIIPPEKYTDVRWIPEGPIKASEQQIYTYRIEVK